MFTKNQNTNLALSLIAIIIGMILLAYASVPIYSIFCKITGYGGTTQRAQKISYVKGKRKLKIQFDANISPELKWTFKPNQKSVNIITGENTLVFYSARNLTTNPIVGTAVYNITPHKAGIYFNKIQCFCFDEQLLKPHEDALFPVSFFIDPALDSDPDLTEVSEITLSYTFFKTFYDQKPT